jgi:hypothetical protein
VSYIYPLLKTEISINHPEIDLPHFVTHNITEVTRSNHSGLAVQALRLIKEKCHFLGVTEKEVNRLVEEKQRKRVSVVKKLDFESCDDEDESNKSDKQDKAEKHAKSPK